MAQRETDEATRRSFESSKPWIKLILASVLLNALMLATFVTSTPTASPAARWMTAYYEVKYRIAPINSDKPALSRLHLRAALVSTAECVACHGDKLHSRFPLHRIHLANDLLPGLSCHDCHRRVDLTPRSNIAGGRWVDLRFCKKCHSAFPGLRPRSSMQPTDFDVDCTTCHTGRSSFRHARPYLSQIISPKECKGCHGGRVLPWTPLHERSDWLKLHGAEALRAGTRGCFQCHDFGLRFCDTCHAVRPPSHVPADEWKATHAQAARADTRVCYACHELNFCRKCHVNHEAGWKDAHPKFVAARGTGTCVNCHSTSFCSACHAGLSVSSNELRGVR
jgi:predicted CXXCH cytochrome family protein